MKGLKQTITALFAALAVVAAGAQARYFNTARMSDAVKAEVVNAADSMGMMSSESVATYLDTINTAGYERYVAEVSMPRYCFLPAVYRGYIYADTTSVFTPNVSGVPGAEWLENELASQRVFEQMSRRLFFEQPELVRYNIYTLPTPPKRYEASVDPREHTIKISEYLDKPLSDPQIEIHSVHRHWIRTFSASLQFSQAYVSPNWYQGGNNNLNMLANIYYNVKLNQEFHPNLLFETTAQYKLGMNSAPDDSIHNYNISDDLFQVNTTFGVKAAKRWYYSFTGQFKTQLLQSFQSNSTTLRSAFLSPGELTAGVGMTYNYANDKKTVTFDASIAPLSYSLRTCINHNIDPTLYNIDAGRITKHKFGSSAELKFFWKISYNIAFSSRLFAFTDYDSAQADWENTLSFEINRFLTTQIYAHARYDSATPHCDDPKWKKLQVKEIFSIGFAYKFGSI